MFKFWIEINYFVSLHKKRSISLIKTVHYETTKQVHHDGWVTTVT